MSARLPYRPVVRFAPSPNGFLHLGHAYSAVLNERFARRHGGRFLLRIEDIDSTRARPHFVEAILEDLRWLGIDWEEPVRRQSQHMQDYRQALDDLRSQGLLYPCWCSRQDIVRATASDPSWPRDPDGSLVYPGTCRQRSASNVQAKMTGEPQFAWRLDMPRALSSVAADIAWGEFGETGEVRRIDADCAAWGDVVLARKDIGASYHVAVVVDDALQGVTDVIRGMDLFHATAVHRLLQELFRFRSPSYRHHRLIKDETDIKLAKSARSKSLRQWREEGSTAADVRSMLDRLTFP